MKGSLINKMPGTDDRNLPACGLSIPYMLTHPGKLRLWAASSASGTSGTMSTLWTGTCWSWRGRTETRTGPLRRSSRRSTPFGVAYRSCGSWTSPGRALSGIPGRRQPGQYHCVPPQGQEGEHPADSVQLLSCGPAIPPRAHGGYLYLPVQHRLTRLRWTGGGDAGPVKSQVYRVPRPGAGHHCSCPHERRHLQVHPQVPVAGKKPPKPRPRLQSPTRQPRRPPCKAPRNPDAFSS